MEILKEIAKTFLAGLGMMVAGGIIVFVSVLSFNLVMTYIPKEILQYFYQIALFGLKE